MHKVLILGAGKIGRAVAVMLADSNDYNVVLIDIVPTPNFPPPALASKISLMPCSLEDILRVPESLPTADAMVSCLPFSMTQAAASLAKAKGMNYFDLTEDRASSEGIRLMAQDSASLFVTQCGLAPGFIGMAGLDLLGQLDSPENLQIRVGALPIYPSNRLRYNLTWSTDGLINQYVQDCDSIKDYKHCIIPPMEGYEKFFVDWEEYEAFNTSGGCGSIFHELIGRVRTMNYKTIRYKGHRDEMLLLLEDLNLRSRPEALVQLLNSSVPTTRQDKVIVWAQATGYRDNRLEQINRSATISHGAICGYDLSAIQITTAAGVCAPVDLALNHRLEQRAGWLPSHRINLSTFLNNRFGKHFISWALST